MAYEEEVLRDLPEPVGPSGRVVVGIKTLLLFYAGIRQQLGPSFRGLPGPQLPAVHDPDDADPALDHEPRNPFRLLPALLREGTCGILGLRLGLPMLDQVQAHGNFPPTADYVDRGTDLAMDPRTRPDPWPRTPEELVAQQLELARLASEPWRFSGGLQSVAGCFVCFPRGRVGPGAAGEVGWAAAALLKGERLVATATVRGEAAWPYEPGLLALREGPLLEAAVRALPERPELLVVNATGRDHPRRAGLAVHLGFRLGLPTVGVTRRPMLARGDPPQASRGSVSPLWLGGEVVAYWVRTKQGTAPLVAHAGWRTDPQTAAEVLLRLTGRWRTPEPLRSARTAARALRAASPPREHE